MQHKHNDKQIMLLMKMSVLFLLLFFANSGKVIEILNEALCSDAYVFLTTWLYMNLEYDIKVDPSEKTVFQYLNDECNLCKYANKYAHRK